MLKNFMNNIMPAFIIVLVATAAWGMTNIDLATVTSSDTLTVSRWNTLVTTIESNNAANNTIFHNSTSSHNTRINTKLTTTVFTGYTSTGRMTKAAFTSYSGFEVTRNGTKHDKTAFTSYSTSEVTRMAAKADSIKYGGIYAFNNSSSVTLTSQSTWYKLSNVQFANDIYSGVTNDAANERIVLPTAGVYLVTLDLCTTASTSSNYIHRMFRNNTSIDNIGVRHDSAAAAESESFSRSGLTRVGANAVIDLRSMCTTGAGKIITPSVIGISVIRVAD